MSAPIPVIAFDLKGRGNNRRLEGKRDEGIPRKDQDKNKVWGSHYDIFPQYERIRVRTGF